ncbi:MAG: long-chain fatty aldehyde decarbonylase [Pseudomonadota bacterium]
MNGIAKADRSPGAAEDGGAGAGAASVDKLMGLAVFGELTAARTYNHMSKLRPEHGELLRKFAAMEGAHASWFMGASRDNGINPDRDFAMQELGYLTDQVNEYSDAADFDSLAVVQGFIVESLAIATYEPFLDIADRYPGSRVAFEQALREEQYHVEWIKRYFRLRFYDAEDEFVALTEKVNVRGVDCVGGTMMNIARLLDEVGISGTDCAGALMDNYAALLEEAGIERKAATRNVVKLFTPLIKAYREQSDATAP